MPIVSPFVPESLPFRIALIAICSLSIITSPLWFVLEFGAESVQAPRSMAVPTASVGELPWPPTASCTVYSNDSIAELDLTHPAYRWDTLDVQFCYDIQPARWQSCFLTVFDSLLYQQRWDTLAQPLFWRLVMRMNNDSCIVNLGETRTIVDIKPTRWWTQLGDSLQEAYKDSVRSRYQLASHSPIYVTAGKRHYYAFDKVLPSIGRGIEAFEAAGVDPWYAQAILLIESPGQLQYSPVGAYGSFQLMKEVALEQGLVVNDSIDEREDFAKAAQGAASLLSSRCIPQIKRLMRKHGLAFRESDLWFRLLVLHAYHAGAGNVAGVLEQIQPVAGGMGLMQQVWTTEYGGFKNASQNYSQVALASLLELDQLLTNLPDSLCNEQQPVLTDTRTLLAP